MSFNETYHQGWVFHRDTYVDIDFFMSMETGILLVYGPPLSMKSYYLLSLAKTRNDTAYVSLKPG